ncbi:unnamed protein product [Symbiodinium natans]|uniref:Uncharacterized protein n=1 Tax=Symbiodinium natans TaxID=878477 RepID=A0A812PIE1_9DINO|nr:unnamed protein product [Symbiodinium natans]
MAERVRVSLPAGAHQAHALPLSGLQAAVLHWTAVVLDERTVELEVCAQLHSEEGAQRIQLSRAACGGTFVGRFVPCEDRRLRAAKASKLAVDSVVFSFSNASWFAHKEVELITLWEELPGAYVSPNFRAKTVEESAEYPREQSTPPLYLDELDNDCNQEYDWRYDAADEESGDTVDASPTPSTEEDEETARRARALAKAQRYGYAV